ncbi:hypothetical protein OAM18_03750 [Candidatus Pelagibacter sp.]|nr:hypothetical protein [Candidatus Pelagibacter sp.]
MSQILILLFFYFLILYSIVGYGKIFTLFNSNYQASSFDGLLGIALLILISYFTNILFPHNFLHNSLIIFFGLVIFIFDFIKNFSKRVSEYRDVTIIFAIIFIAILMYKNHDDFFYYHFPYALILTNFEKIFGLGFMGHGYRTPSSIFYLNSLFYLPGIKYYLMNSGATYILGFSNYILFKNIKDLTKKNIFNHILFLSIFSLVYINTIFVRIAEHGTDRSALILIFVMSIYYLQSVNLKKNQFNYDYFNSFYSKLALLFAIIISLKSFYIIYLIIFLLWFFQIKKFLNLNALINLVFKNYYTYLFILFFSFTIFTTFSNTGCLIYPATFTCFDEFSWSIPLAQVDQMQLWYEQWSKAGASPNFRVADPLTYVSKFNWVGNWIDMYFFTKVTDNIFALILISGIVFFLFSHNCQKIKKVAFNNDYNLFYYLILFLFFEWFYNHPSLRYGGYTLLALIFFIPISIYLSRFKFNPLILKKKIYFILLLTLLIFVSRNMLRINKEFKQYGYNPIKGAFFNLNKVGFIINDEVETLYKNKGKGFLIIKK